MRNADVVSPNIVGKVRLLFKENRYHVMNNRHYILGFTINLIYVSRLCKQDYKISFKSNRMTIFKTMKEMFVLYFWKVTFIR